MVLIFAGGLVIAWTDGTDSNIGDGDDILTYEVPHGEHITGVYSYCTDYTKNKVSNIVFILSNGMTLGKKILNHWLMDVDFNKEIDCETN